MLRAGTTCYCKCLVAVSLQVLWASRKDGGVDDTDDSRGGGVILDEGYSVF